MDYTLEDDVYICKYNEPTPPSYEHSLFTEIYNENFSCRGSFGELNNSHLIDMAERYGFSNDLIFDFNEFINTCEREQSKKRSEEKPKKA